MYKISFRGFIKKRNQKLSSLLSVLSASNNEDLIHKLRIELKKINAVVRLFQFNKKKIINNKTIKELHKLFQNIGRIRAFQVELKKLKLYYPKSNLDNYIKSIENKKKKQELDVYEKYRDTQLKLKIYRHSIAELSINEISSFLMWCFKSAEKLKLKKSDFHNIRCKLKDALYVVDFIKSAFFKQIGSKQKKITESIGEWHDLVFIKENIIKNKNDKYLIYNNLDMVINNLDKRILIEKRKIKSTQ